MEKIKTQYGNATFDQKRGYRITSKKEGNHKKFLHKLIWEKHNGKIPNNAYIIHIDGNKKNNSITNLKLKFKRKSFNTNFGKAIISDNGYIQIVSGKFHNQLLHRLIWEKHYGEIPKGYHIHHRDLNKLNNNIENLELISSSQHSTLHHKKNNLRIIKAGISRGRAYKLVSADTTIY